MIAYLSSIGLPAAAATLRKDFKLEDDTFDEPHRRNIKIYWRRKIGQVLFDCKRRSADLLLSSGYGRFS
jgi:hypothetical protein